MLKCNKCGMIEKSNKPSIEHGKIGLVIYPMKNSSTKCDGKFKPYSESRGSVKE